MRFAGRKIHASYPLRPEVNLAAANHADDKTLPTPIQEYVAVVFKNMTYYPSSKKMTVKF